MISKNSDHDSRDSETLIEELFTRADSASRTDITYATDLLAILEKTADVGGLAKGQILFALGKIETISKANGSWSQIQPRLTQTIVPRLEKLYGALAKVEVPIAVKDNFLERSAELNQLLVMLQSSSKGEIQQIANRIVQILGFRNAKFEWQAEEKPGKNNPPLIVYPD